LTGQTEKMTRSMAEIEETVSVLSEEYPIYGLVELSERLELVSKELRESLSRFSVA
jgi:hypothetical protein